MDDMAEIAHGDGDYDTEDRTTCLHCGKEVPNLAEAEYETWFEGNTLVCQFYHWNCLTNEAGDGG